MDEQNKLIEQMQELGYSRELSVKVIKKSGAKTIDEILNWIELTEENEDYNNSEVEDTSQNDVNEKSMNNSDNMNKDNLGSTTENKTKLSPEEVQKKALELQKKIREKKLIKEKEEELQKEKNRIAMAKEIQKRREQLEEYERKKYIETLEREKNEHKKEKQKQLELLKREYEAKFGIEYKHEEVKKSINELTENERREEIAILLNSLKNKNKDKKKELISSLNILKTYFGNIKDNILEKKYQRIKKENKIFVEKIKIYEEMLKIFLLVGFEDTGEFYVIKNYPNTYLLSSAMKFIDLIIKTLNQ
ncbi:conserved Plasmodium protein, unknown function [Plasmodium gallinaceum]|uniref:UBA domain-containing protein n=1 Tax=Plasmodium gallinaceum TaxID=5849 RepID=A0A1J1GX90_PLAGA|nr:conserved Plasmodium protein, unknown function [Plasmodium gallinaceum]CRG96864.1 conserved Plasmodium protein, unknown function [Plasmodium gallinaceum]